MSKPRRNTMKTIWSVLRLAAVAGCVSVANAAPTIVFDRLVYDFGKTGQVETVTGSFKYTNGGDAVLKIRPPETTCGCTIASLKPDTLASGESGELVFTLALGRARATLEKHITVASNDPANPEVVLSIKADFTPLYEVAPMMLSPSVPRNERLTNLVVNLTRTDGRPLRIGRLSPSKPWISATMDPPEGPGGSTARLHVGVTGEGAPRRFSEFVHVYGVDDTNAPVTMVYVYGQILGDLTLEPESMYWSLPDGRTLESDRAEARATRRVIIRTAKGKTFELRNARSTNPGLKLEVVPREGGTAYELVATLQAAPGQSLAGIVSIDTSVTTQPRLEVPFIVHVAK